MVLHLHSRIISDFEQIFSIPILLECSILLNYMLVKRKIFC